MINCLIVDDEPGNIRILRKMLEEYCPQVVVMGEALNPDEAETLIQKLEPRLVFLDIEMPFGNAFDLLDRLMPVSFEIIFVTAFNDYALKAFKYSALDYLLKPINIKELCHAIEKVSEKIRLRSSSTQLANLLANLRQPDVNSYKIALPTIDGLDFVLVDQIIRCEAVGGYTAFYLKTREKIVSARNIKEYEDLLPPSLFLRVHNSHIINLMYIKAYHKGRGGYVEMEDGTTIELAIRRKKEFLNRFRL
jgi:two-component system LytT family response regulator